MDINSKNIVEYVSGCSQLALLLESSSYPKPGNVHRIADFEDTKYEHFLASSIAVGQAIREATKQGIRVALGDIDYEQIEIGRIIYEATSSMMQWQHGGNTILGSILLLVPISAAAGLTWVKKSNNMKNLRNSLIKITHSTTPEDAVYVYDAIKLSDAGGLGSSDRFDVTKKNSRQEILNSSISLFEIFQISSEYDTISSEWVNDFKITFQIGYPYFLSQIEKYHDCNTAIVHTFLKILSMFPDTLIARKTDLVRAQEISTAASKALEVGGMTSELGREKLAALDIRLRTRDHRLNPGTTADLTCSSLTIATLNGYRP
ncbi:ATP--dephospho-CoA triphosphoribosyl transferase CitG [Candidatus Bathyarchaeota archaeon]|nr:ATP--dephospho-CoA triphosphoribosyl transferase CitG [Candidatus Bathyarchaeota archaeon]